jgi:hypothetical protein
MPFYRVKLTAIKEFIIEAENEQAALDHNMTRREQNRGFVEWKTSEAKTEQIGEAEAKLMLEEQSC